VLHEEAAWGEGGVLYSPGHAEYPIALTFPARLGWGHCVAVSLSMGAGSVFALLCEVDVGGEWQRWPLRIVGIVERVDGMVGGGSIVRWAGDRVVTLVGR
jgi:hypothetical protein